MNGIRVHEGLVRLVLAVAAAAWSGQAYGQLTRTWVSGLGSDANPCNRAAPCKTFAGAISKTAVGGEINCLDPGGFGGISITKPISIICDYSEGGILLANAGVNGIVIDLPSATDRVFLSGLDLNGTGSAQNGIHIVSGGIVHLRNSVIRNYRATNGVGLSIQPAGPLMLAVSNTTIADNGSGFTGGGILIQPTGAGSARVTLSESRVQHNSNHQVRVDTAGNSGAGISLFVENSRIMGGINGIAISQPPATSSVTGMIVDSFIALGSGTGLSASGGNSRVRVRNTTITGWGTGVAQAGGAIINTYGNNVTDGNGAPGAFTLPALPES